jgi:hypothetical protein
MKEVAFYNSTESSSSFNEEATANDIPVEF